MIVPRHAISVCIIITGLFGVFGSMVAAQSSADLSSTVSDVIPTDSDIAVQQSPQNPGAFATVSLRLTSDLVDVTKYPISWAVDGVIVTSGVGMRSFSVTTKNYNVDSVITATIQLPSGPFIKTIRLRPGDLVLLWEATDSYVPPFYPGKKLPSREALIKFAAMPNFDGTNVSAGAASSIYRWERNGNVMTESSGYGKNSFLILHNRVRPNEQVTVTATDTNGNQAKKSLTLTPVDPRILFYEKPTATGINSPTTLSSLVLNKPSTSIIAEPYFFSVPGGDVAGLSFSWTMNGNPVGIRDGQNPQTIRLDNANSSGTSYLGLSIESAAKILQSATATLPVSFFQK